MRTTIVISRGFGEDARPDFENGLAARCAAVDGLETILVPHLVHLPSDSPVWEDLRLLGGRVVLVGPLFPRPAEWILRERGVTPAEFAALRLGDYPTAAAAHAAVRAAAGLAEPAEPAPAPAAPRELGTPPAGERWYPVLDATRCRHCGNCHQFCLFGVYERDEAGRVRVASPDSCKAGCPACSRVCPEGAIMFPLYARDEAIAGAPGTRVAPPDAAARKMFYTRTRRTCPICGSTPDRPGAGAPGTVCEECGRALATPSAPEPASAAGGGMADIVRSDIDALLDELDGLNGRNGGGE